MADMAAEVQVGIGAKVASRPARPEGRMQGLITQLESVLRLPRGDIRRTTAIGGYAVLGASLPKGFEIPETPYALGQGNQSELDEDTPKLIIRYFKRCLHPAPDEKPEKFLSFTEMRILAMNFGLLGRNIEVNEIGNELKKSESWVLDQKRKALGKLSVLSTEYK